ncbi:MAG: phage tail length tape measure family protein, partial [Hydrogenophaga sp.]|uniref:phage tail length tape measure family protein n=1 Tax=Hydrogenophaga sp. TaxID=1904254 RepID=UPI003D9AC23F
AEAAARAAVTAATAAQRTAQAGVTASSQQDTAAKKAAADALRHEQELMRQNRAEKNLLAQANRQLAMQMTDVVTSISSGMPVWMVAIQQGGQIRDAYGGVTPALRAMLGMLTPTVLAVAGLGVAAGAAGLAFFQGWEQSKRFADGMALTGNTAALTEGQFNSMVGSLANARSVSAGAVRDLMQVLATSGEQTSGTLDASARAAIALSKVNGQTAAETAQGFAGMGDSVTNWAAKANKAYNYLTAEQYKQIMALEAQGRTSEAMRLNMEALADTMETRNVRSLGYLETALKGVTTWFGNMWDAANGWGRAETAEDKIAKLQERLKRPGSTEYIVFPWSGGKSAVDRDKEQLEMLQREAARTAMRTADTTAAQAAEQEAILKASRGYQDSLLAIQAAGDALVLAQQQAGFTARRAQADQAYAELRMSGERYRAELINIERGKIAAQEEAARRSIAIESARVVKTEQETNARTAAVTAAQARLVAAGAERARLEADYAGFRGIFDLKPRNVSETPAADFGRGELAGDKAAEQIRAQAEATRQLALAQADYVRNLQAAAQARGNANNRDLAGMRMGDAARQVAAREASINDRFTSDRQQLDGDLANNRIGQKTYEARLAALQTYHQAALREEAAYQTARRDLEADAGVGLDRALANYAEGARNAARTSEQAWTGAFQSMEDGIVRFAMTGKLSFNDLVGSVVAGIIRMQLQAQLSGLFSTGMNMLSSFMGAGASSGLGNGAPFGGAGSVFHGGGQVGHDAPAAMRWMPAGTWDRAPRFHTGRLQGNEMAAILQKDESVLTPGQMRQLAPAGRGTTVALSLNVINNTGTPVQATARQRGDGGIDVLLDAARQAVAGDIASGQGPVTEALQGRFNLRPAMA